jgi:D-ribose pyranose/furanose isomerase RbsD
MSQATQISFTNSRVKIVQILFNFFLFHFFIIQVTSNTKLFMDMSVKIVQIALKKENRKEMTAEFAELVRPTYTAELDIKKHDCLKKMAAKNDCVCRAGSSHAHSRAV